MASQAVGQSPSPAVDGSVSSPAGGTTVTVDSTGTYVIPVKWDASCPDTNGTYLPFWYWYVHIYVTHQDGSEANFQSVAYTDTEASGPNDDTQGMTVTMAAGLSTETFTVHVSLLCGAEQVIGSPSITLTKCDPNGYTRAQHEFDAASALLDSGTKNLIEADQQLVQFVKDYLHDVVEIAPEKYDALQVLQEISTHVAEVGEVGGVVVGLSITAEQLELLRKDYVRLSAAAQADFKQAQRLTTLGKADLNKALAAKGCLDPIEGQLNKLLADQKRDGDAHALIDTWDNNGYLYVSPSTHELVDEATALKQAKAALTRRHAGIRARAQSTAASVAERAKSAAASVMADAAQLRLAISDIDRALKDDGSIRRDTARLEAATVAALKGLEALLATGQ